MHADAPPPQEQAERSVTPAEFVDASTRAVPRVKPRGPSTQVETALAPVRAKVYPRAVSGVFARWRIALVIATQLLFYGLPWLQYNGRQAVLFDLGARKFYLFGMVLWPQDVIYLAMLLVLAAFSLFLFTAIAGRLFWSTPKSSCGWNAKSKAIVWRVFVLMARHGVCTSCA